MLRILPHAAGTANAAKDQDSALGILLRRATRVVPILPTDWTLKTHCMLVLPADWTRRRTPKSDDWLYLPTVYPADSFITLHRRAGVTA